MFPRMLHFVHLIVAQSCLSVGGLSQRVTSKLPLIIIEFSLFAGVRGPQQPGLQGEVAPCALSERRPRVMPPQVRFTATSVGPDAVWFGFGRCRGSSSGFKSRAVQASPACKLQLESMLFSEKYLGAFSGFPVKFCDPASRFA